MILKVSCPSCHHVHDVPYVYLRGESRLLKCAQCEHVWRYFRPQEEEPIAQAPQELPKPKEMEQVRQELTPPPIPDPFGENQNMEEFTKNPYKIKGASKGYHLDWWLLLVACIIAGFVIAKEMGSLSHISSLYHQVHSFFLKTLHSLHLGREQKDEHSTDSSPTQQKVVLNVLTSHLYTENDEPMILIKGEVVNNTKDSLKAPLVTIRIMDKCNEGDSGLCERHSWTHQVEGGEITPRESRIFESKAPCKKKEQPESIQIDFES